MYHRYSNDNRSSNRFLIRTYKCCLYTLLSINNKSSTISRLWIIREKFAPLAAVSSRNTIVQYVASDPPEARKHPYTTFVQNNGFPRTYMWNRCKTTGLPFLYSLIMPVIMTEAPFRVLNRCTVTNALFVSGPNIPRRDVSSQSSRRWKKVENIDLWYIVHPPITRTANRWILHRLYK